MRTNRHRVIVALIALSLLAFAAPAHAASPAQERLGADGWAAKQIGKGELRQRDRKLAGSLPGRAKLGYHPETGRVRFISGTPLTPLTSAVVGVANGSRRLSNADARGSARRFVERYGELFGLKRPGRELQVRSTRRKQGSVGTFGAAGAITNGVDNATVRFAQTRSGVPVMGAELVVQVSADGEVLSAAGEVLPTGAKATTQPRVTATRARNAAAAWMAREADRPRRAVTTRSEGLGIYDPRIMGDPILAQVGRRLVWQIDTKLSAGGPRRAADRRLVIVDALGGQVLHSIGRVHDALTRRICDNRNTAGRAWSCSAPFTRTEGQPSTGVGEVDALYRLMGVTYDYFADTFGRDGIDGKGGRLKATVRYCPAYGCPWRNAEWKWAQQQAIFGKGWADADDIVGHEFTHGLLDHTAPFFYHYQSGAINESFADVFGELIDLSHPGGKDTAFTKWKIGEDTPIGVFRDMKDPTRFGHPDRVRSPKWHSGSSDYGGVHRNNGVGNKAAFLMAQGGTFRGVKVAAIGRTRMARVWYRALTTRLTSAANYIDLGDALNAACTDLAGSGGMTLAHCKSVRDAVKATQMAEKPKVWAPKTAPVCSHSKRPLNVFRDDLEDPSADLWVVSTLAGDNKGWFYPQNPNNSPAWDGTWSSSGKRNFYAPNRGSRSDATIRLKQSLVLPAKAYLRFEHGYSFDKDSKRRYDGGVVEIKVGDAPWRNITKRFTHGGYNGTIAKGHGNPLKGKRAYTGNSHGWSEARADLSPFAGQSIRLRFRMGSDRSIGARGWYVDDIRVYACAADTTDPTGSLLIESGAATTAHAKVQVAVNSDDIGSWVTKLRVSGSSRMNDAGTQLLKGISMPIRDEVSWDLADTTFGGSGKPGNRRIYAQVRDAAGNWSSVFSDEIELLP